MSTLATDDSAPAGDEPRTPHPSRVQRIPFIPLAVAVALIAAAHTIVRALAPV